MFTLVGVRNDNNLCIGLLLDLWYKDNRALPYWVGTDVALMSGPTFSFMSFESRLKFDSGKMWSGGFHSGFAFI